MHALFLKKVVLAIALALGLAALCPAFAEDAPKPKAVATIFSYYDALRAIGGPDVESIILLPPGQSPHEYTPTINDKVKIAGAQLIIKNGLNIDNWVDKLAEVAPNAIVLDVSQLVKQKGIEPLQTREVSITPQSEKKAGSEEDVSAGNPHIWLDPRVQAMAAEAILDDLIKIDPAHKLGYQTRARTYLDDLKELDHDFAQAAAGFSQKDFIGFHSAYAYLARRYGLNQVASVEELPDQGPSLAQQVNIIHLIQEKHIHVIFIENAFPARAADRIIEETGVKTGVLQPLETYDKLDQTYVSLMRENLESLKKALQ